MLIRILAPGSPSATVATPMGPEGFSTQFDVVGAASTAPSVDSSRYGVVAMLLVVLACLVVAMAVAHIVRRQKCTARPIPPRTELIVADLRRLHDEVAHSSPSSWVRRVGLLAAYEDVLLRACEAAGVTDPPLSEIGDRDTSAAMSFERSMARMRTEAELEAVGFVLTGTPPPRRSWSAGL